MSIQRTIKSQKIPPTFIRLKYTSLVYKETSQLSIKLLHVKAIKHERKEKKKVGFVGPK